MEAEFCFNLSNADILAKVKQALVLPRVLDLLLKGAQLVQAYLHVIQKVADRVVHIGQLAKILLINLIVLDLQKPPVMLVLTLGEHFETFLDFTAKDGYVLLQRLHFKQTLLSLIQIYILVYVRCDAKLACA